MLLYLVIGLMIGLMEVYYNRFIIKAGNSKTGFCITVIIITLLNVLLWPITIIEIIIKFILYVKNL